MGARVRTRLATLKMEDMEPDAVQPLPETTIVMRIRAGDPPEGHVVAGDHELPFTGWVALVSLLSQLASGGTTVS